MTHSAPRRWAEGSNNRRVRRARFRTIQPGPKELLASGWQAEYAVGRLERSVWEGGWSKAYVRHEASRVHHAHRRRGCVTARGAGPAADDAGGGLPQQRLARSLRTPRR